MAASRKLYVALAATIRDHAEYRPERANRLSTIRSLAKDLARDLARDNANFDQGMFLAACGLAEEVKAGG